VSDHSEMESSDLAPSFATILVVEDDPDPGLVLLRFLEEEVPCRVVLSPDGFQALKLVRSITPQLFLLDYNLPSMDGLELVDTLRAILSLEQTPIILMSAHMPREGVKQRQLQAIHKPFDFNALIQLVREQLPFAD
jgi:CheY-like chemotaxis protein